MNKEIFINEKNALAAEIEAVENAIKELQASIVNKKDDLRILDRLQQKYFPAIEPEIEPQPDPEPLPEVPAETQPEVETAVPAAADTLIYQ